MSDDDFDEEETIQAAIRRGEEAADAGRVVDDPTGNPFATHLAKVVWSEPAWADLQAIGRKLAQHGRSAAKKTKFALTAAAGTLSVHPLHGVPFPPGSRGSVREFVLAGRFCLFYRFVESANQVEILAIFDNTPEAPPFSE
jgi:plasmid stabilization system protein ParE